MARDVRKIAHVRNAYSPRSDPAAALDDPHDLRRVRVVTAAVSKSLTKIYQTEASLLVSVAANVQSFDTVQASQSFARSYSEIISSRNIAERVATELGDGTTADDLLGVVAFEPLTETQLLQIAAEDPDPARAQSIANTYATVFDGYARIELEPTTQAEVTVADPAPAPGSPARPKPTVYTLLAGMLGLGLGLGLAFLREQLDRRIRGADELEERSTCRSWAGSQPVAGAGAAPRRSRRPFASCAPTCSSSAPMRP